MCEISLSRTPTPPRAIVLWRHCGHAGRRGRQRVSGICPHPHVLRDGYILTSVVRMLLLDVVQPVFDQSGFITVNIDAPEGLSMCIHLESAHVSCLVVSERVDGLLMLSCE